MSGDWDKFKSKSSLPRYQFAKENETDLLKFLKVSKENKLLGRNVDLKTYDLWKHLLPPDLHLLQKLDIYESETCTIPTIDLLSDEEEVNAQFLKDDDNEEHYIKENKDQSTITDIAFAIKEDLETQSDLLTLTKEHVLKLSNSELDILFSILKETLDTEEIYCVGTAIQTVAYNDLLITAFCHGLLMSKIRKVYNEKFVTLMIDLIDKHSTVVREECLIPMLQTIDDQEINIVLQYIKKLPINFQAALIRDFILSIDRLNDKYLTIIENLIIVQIEYEALNKLVEMLSNVAEEHTKDKHFGKVLIQVIDNLGHDKKELEQPLRHIISGHKSVWQSKLQKIFKNCYEDSQLFSQSFQD